MSDPHIVSSDIPVRRPPAAERPARGRPSIAALAAIAAGAIVLLDSAVETTASGSPVRVPVLAVAVLYVVATALTWRARLQWRTRLLIAVSSVLGMLAVTAWLPGGLADGIRLAGRPTAAVLSGASALALLVAAVAWARASAAPVAARVAVAVLACYAIAAFALGAWHGTPYAALFAGSSSWSAAPRWLQGATLGGLVVLPASLLLGLAGGLRRGAREWRPLQIVSLALSVVLVVSGFTNAAAIGTGQLALAIPAAVATAREAAPASAAIGPPDRASLTAFRDVAARVHAETSASDFNVDLKADQLGPDVARLFAFVRDDVRTEIYSGVLRGPSGTLIARAGNAWDRAALLASLLGHHGREVRFARAQLPPDRAAALVARMFDEAQARAVHATRPVDVPQPLLASARSLTASLQGEWQDAQRDLFRALERSGVRLGTSQPLSDGTLEREAADHAWVEYRDGDHWVPLDPTAADRPGVAVAAASQTLAEIPDALWHRVTFHVKVEQRQNQKVEEHDVFTWSTTAAALDGARVLLAHRMTHTIAGDWRAIPTLFVDDRAYGAMSFTEHGVWVGKSGVASDLIAQARETATGAGHQVLDLFAPPPPAQPSAQAAPQATAQPTAQPVAQAASAELTAVSLDVDFTSPGGRTDTARRQILDRVGPAARAQGAIATAPLAPLSSVAGIPVALAGLYACAVTSGPLDARLPLQSVGADLRAVDDAIAVRETAATPASREKVAAPAGASVQDRERADRMLAALPRILETTALTVHALSDQLSRQLRTGTPGAIHWYEATPRLAIASFDLVGRTVAIDLRRNDLRVVGRGVPGADLVRANVARGVLDGVMEDFVSRALSAPDGVTSSTVAILAQADREHVPVAVVRDAAGIARLASPEPVRPLIARSLQEQHVVVAPERPMPVGGEPHFAWWQVNPETGDVLGILDSGLHGGQPLAEDAALADTVEVPAARAIGGGVDVYAATQQIQAVQAAGGLNITSVSIGIVIGGLAALAGLCLANSN